jgi:hypothetical protein
VHGGRGEGPGEEGREDEQAEVHGGWGGGASCGARP